MYATRLILPRFYNCAYNILDIKMLIFKHIFTF